LAVFAPKHQGLYLAPDDSAFRLHIGPGEIWSEELYRYRVARRQLAALGLSSRPQDIGRWLTTGGKRYRLLPHSADTLRCEEWERDTACTLRSGDKSKVRWLQGAYYLSNPAGDYWSVERLVLDGRQLSWQVLNNDTLRIAVLPEGVVRRTATGGDVRWLLQPATARQARQIGRYEGLWRPLRVLERQ